MFVRLIAGCSLLLVLGCRPFLVVPGGKLDGIDTPAPGDWAFLEEVSTVQLETNPGDPYSVNIWAVGMRSGLYVHAGANRATWVEHMEANPAVRIRVEGMLYDLRADRVESQQEFTQFSDVYEKKYDTRPRNEDVSQAYLFRLTAR